MNPRILLVTTCRWVATARLAMSFADAGCEVEAVCPDKHPLGRTDGALRMYTYRPLDPVRSIGAAIEASQPALVIPCDDLATLCLHRLFETARASGQRGMATCTLLERSLGEAFSFSIVMARTRLIALAHEQGIRVPPTAVVRTSADLADWAREHGLPAFLKADGTYGGRGVRVVHSQTDGDAALEALSAPPSPTRAIKRAFVNGDFNYLLPCVQGTRPVVNVQRSIPGPDASTTVACWNGKVLASISVVVLHTLDAYGPASVVQLIDNREMSDAAEKMVSTLRLSGLVGFDFILEKRTGDAYLIELNPRATQIGHLPLGPGRDLPASLRAVLSDEPQRPLRPVRATDVVAFFPQEWFRDPGSPFLSTAYHDVPWEQPELVRACMEETTISRVWAAMMGRMPASRIVLEERAPQFGHSSTFSEDPQ
jgi:hypothetical protein